MERGGWGWGWGRRGGGTGLRCAGRLPVRPRSAGVDEIPPLAEPRRGGGSRTMWRLRHGGARQRARRDLRRARAIGARGAAGGWGGGVRGSPAGREKLRGGGGVRAGFWGLARRALHAAATRARDARAGPCGGDWRCAGRAAATCDARAVRPGSTVTACDAQAVKSGAWGRIGGEGGEGGGAS